MTHSPAAQAAPAQTRSLWTSKHLPLLVAAGVSVFATAAFFAPVVFGHRIFVERDILRVYYPLHKFWVDQVRSGHFPLWYPYDGLGQPFVGMVISGAFHPFNLLYLALPLGEAMSVSVVLCYPLALTGTLLFCRRWGMGLAPSLLAGTVFAFNGYLVAITNNPGYLAAAATFPFAFWAVDRFFDSPRLLSCATAALFLALVLFAGDSQSFAVASTLTVPLALCSRTRRPLRRSAWLLLSLFSLTALFTLPQLVSAFQVVRAGNPGARSLSTATVWSLPPLRLYDLIVGPAWAAHFHPRLAYQDLTHSLTGGPFSSLWVDSIHLGVLPVALAGAGLFAARRRWRGWALAAASVTLLWLALGSFGGFYGLLYRLVPPWRPFRYPVKLTPYFLFGAALGAGWGLKVCLERTRYRRTLGAVLAGAAVVLLSVACVPALQALLVRSALSAGSSEAARLPSLIEAVRVTCLHSGLVALLATLAVWAPLRDDLRATLLCLTTLSALFVANRSTYSTAMPEVLTTSPGLLDRVLADPDVGLGRGRVASAADAGGIPHSTGLSAAEIDATFNLIALRADSPALHGVESLETYLPAVSRAFANMQAKHPRWLGNHTDLYSARYVVVPPGGRINDRQDPLLFSSALGISLVKNRSPRARAYLARGRCLASHEAVVAALLRPQFDPNGPALLECPSSSAPFPTAADPSAGLGTVRLTHYASARVEAEVDARSDAVLILNDADYPGWKATVDGVAAPIRRANGLVRGVEVRAGKHQVTFTYSPPFFWTACCLSLIALALGFGLGGAMERRWGNGPSATPW